LYAFLLYKEGTMVEIYKVMAYIPFLNPIFDEKSKMAARYFL